MDRSDLTLMALVFVYGAVVGAYIGRWALRRTSELEDLRGRIRELEWRGVPSAPAIAGASVKRGQRIGAVKS